MVKISAYPQHPSKYRKGGSGRSGGSAATSTSTSKSSRFASYWWFTKGFQGFLVVYALVLTAKNISMLETILRSSCSSSSTSNHQYNPLDTTILPHPKNQYRSTKKKTKTTATTTSIIQSPTKKSTSASSSQNQQNDHHNNNNNPSQQRNAKTISSRIEATKFTNNFTLTIPSGWTSPACRPHFLHHNSNNNTRTKTKIKRIYVTHMRKAGGSTLRKYFKMVATTYGLQFSTREAGPDEIPGDREDTFYVTHMRDPVSRSLSHFQYEGRWSCPNLNLQNDQNFIPTYENSNTLQDWIKHEFQRSQWTGGHLVTGKHCGHKLWLCSTNCYIKWINWKKGRCVDELQQQDDYDSTEYFVNRALQIFGKYNLIVDMEQLFTIPGYAEKIETLFGVSGLMDLKVRTICDIPSKKANAKYPLYVSDIDRNELHIRNALDYQVYNAIMNCPFMDFPDETIADFV